MRSRSRSPPAARSSVTTHGALANKLGHYAWGRASRNGEARGRPRKDAVKKARDGREIGYVDLVLGEAIRAIPLLLMHMPWRRDVGLGRFQLRGRGR